MPAPRGGLTSNKEKTMKRTIKYLAAVLAAAVLCLALAACGESAGTKYTFKEAKMQLADPSMEHAQETVEETEGAVNNIYANSFITVGGGKITWTIKDASQKMTYTKDGDKYLIGGEYFEMVKQQFPGAEISIYAEEDEEGFHIVEVQPDATMTYYFIRA